MPDVKLSKADLVNRISRHPGHVYPGVAILRRWTKAELATYWSELYQHSLAVDVIGAEQWTMSPDLTL